MVAEYARRLGETHSVDVYWVSDPRDATKYPRLSNVSRMRSYPFRLLLRSPGLPLSFLMPIDLARLSFLNRRIARQIDAEGYDIVLAFASRHTQAPLVLRFLRTPAVYYCTEPFRALYEPTSHPLRHVRLRHKMLVAARAPLRSFLRRVEWQLVQYPTLLCANSGFTASQIRRIYLRDCQVCYHGLDIDTYRALSRESTRDMVIAVGAVHWRKGHEEVIRALGLLPFGARPKLLILGQVANPREEEWLQNLASELNVKLDLLFDKVDNEGLVQLYNQAKLLICAAFWEPFGLTPLESMACGTPVVAVDEGGFRETVVDGVTGLLVPRDITALSEGIRKLLTDDALRARMGKAGIEHVKRNWTWDRGMKRLTQLLQLALEESHTPQQGNPQSS